MILEIISEILNDLRSISEILNDLGNDLGNFKWSRKLSSRKSLLGFRTIQSNHRQVLDFYRIVTARETHYIEQQGTANEFFLSVSVVQSE